MTVPLDALDALVDLDFGMVESGREQMRATGACEIPNFVRPEALPAFVADARRLVPLAHRSGGLGTVYLGFPDESFPLEGVQFQPESFLTLEGTKLLKNVVGR